jgi:LCP family protein required for cell wall assembly
MEHKNGSQIGWYGAAKKRPIIYGRQLAGQYSSDNNGSNNSAAGAEAVTTQEEIKGKEISENSRQIGEAATFSAAKNPQPGQQAANANAKHGNLEKIRSDKKLNGEKSFQLQKNNARRDKKRQPRRIRINVALPGGESLVDQRFRRVGMWWRTFRKWSVRGSAAAVLLLVLTAGFLLGKAYWQMKHVFRGDGHQVAALSAHAKPSLLKGEGDGRINILLLGIGGPGHDGPDLTDTILLYSIDPVNHKAALLSVPRDLWVQNKKLGGQSKINAIYANTKYHDQDVGMSDQKAEADGIKAIEHKVSHVLDVPIHYYALVDFSAFKKAINTVGGITVNVPKTLYDPTMAWQNNWNPVLAKKGVDHFDGYHALLYARSRETSSDFARTKRQRQVITALEGKILSAGTLTNPIKISSLLSNFGNHMQTDMSIRAALRLRQIVAAIPKGATRSIGLTDKGHDVLTTGSQGNQSIVEPKAGLFQYTAIQKFVRGALPDGYIVKEHANIAVLNGTDSLGLASKTADTLKSYGYNVTRVGFAPDNQSHTVVYDLTGGQDGYTKNYMQKRFHTQVKTTLPPGVRDGGADFVIIVGR